MKNVKMALWALAAVFLSVVFFQNREFFLDERAFTVDLYAFRGSTPELPLVLYLGLFFALGFLASFLAGVPAKLRARREIKTANARICELEQCLAQAPAETDRETGVAGAAPAQAGETPEPAA